MLLNCSHRIYGKYMIWCGWCKYEVINVNQRKLEFLTAAFHWDFAQLQRKAAQFSGRLLEPNSNMRYVSFDSMWSVCFWRLVKQFPNFVRTLCIVVVNHPCLSHLLGYSNRGNHYPSCSPLDLLLAASLNKKGSIAASPNLKHFTHAELYIVHIRVATLIAKHVHFWYQTCQIVSVTTALMKDLLLCPIQKASGQSHVMGSEISICSRLLAETSCWYEQPTWKKKKKKNNILVPVSIH